MNVRMKTDGAVGSTNATTNSAGAATASAATTDAAVSATAGSIATTRSMPRSIGKLARFLAVATLGSLAVACSGDVQPLAEAIEVRDLRLDSLSIERPFGTLTPFVVSAGERVTFGLSGLDVNGRTIDEIDPEGRNWRVSDGAFASIDGNGELVALSDGSVTVDVRIGDIAAPPFDVRVATAPLLSIDRIVGADELDPCVVERYTAIGTFADETESERLLRGVAWTTTAAGTERRPSEDRSVVELSASEAGGTVTLVATVEQASLAKEIGVNTSLTGLDLERADQSGSVQSFTVSAGETLDLRAIGRYTGADGVARARDVTDSVVWETVDGAGFASVSNDRETRGRVTATSAGIAQVRARCGNLPSESRQVVVGATTSDSSSAEGLSFDGIDNGRGDGDGGSISIAQSVGQFQLRVSLGSEYDEADDVTDLADWSVVNPGDLPIGAIDSDGLDRGIFSPLNPGVGQIRVDYSGRTVTLTVTVTDN